jgi:hypothetical protein
MYNIVACLTIRIIQLSVCAVCADRQNTSASLDRL